MKKVMLTVGICLLGAASVMAQGRINFNNSSATPLKISANLDGSGAVVLGTASTGQFGIGPSSTRVSLFAGLNSASLSPVLIGTGLRTYVTNSVSASATFQGTFPGGSNLALSGYDGSSPVYLQFIAETITPGYKGESPVILVNLATGVANATAVFATAADASHWNGLTMVPVPEPSTFALAGLGAAAMLIFRRRK